MSDPVIIVAASIEALIAVVGLTLLWRTTIGPALRHEPRPSAMPAWEGLPSDLLMFALTVVVAIFGAVLLANSAVKALKLTGDAGTIVAGTSAQLGMLIGALGYVASSKAFRAHAPLRLRQAIASGFGTFAVCWPLVMGTAKAWEWLLNWAGVPAERQDLIRMFIEAKSPARIIPLVLVATIIAPMSEELVFRAGVFRFFRTRIPRVLAYLLPALLFAGLHVNWTSLEGLASFAPLFVLALVFSFAYERTGNIATTIIAHGLFNLNTIVLIYCGLSDT
jgi:membrane protease YdiL (CAAX protease family)